MAPKRQSPMEEPPSASSSSEDTSSDGDKEEEGSEEQVSEEVEQQQQQQQKQPTTPKKPEPQHPQQKTKPEPESEAESGSEAESESDEEDNVAVKSIASKPKEDTAPSKKVRSSEPTAKKPELAQAVKRVGKEMEKEKNKDSKRAKKENAVIVPASSAMYSPGDAKKTLFQRLWSEDDEIVMLKGILELKEKKGIDAMKDMGAFYESIKKSLNCDGTLAQMKDKIFRLRRKFEKSVKRGKLGENKKFSREHDQLAFDLSKKIWGSERVGGVESKANGNAKKSLDELRAELGVGKGKDGEKKRTVKFDQDFVRVGGMEEYVVKRGLDVIGTTRRAEMEEKWRKLHAEELKLFLKRNELVNEQVKLMLAAYKTEDED